MAGECCNSTFFLPSGLARIGFNAHSIAKHNRISSTSTCFIFLFLSPLLWSSQLSFVIIVVATVWWHTQLYPYTAFKFCYILFINRIAGLICSVLLEALLLFPPMAGWHPKLLDNQLCSHNLSPLETINIHVDVKAVKIPWHWHTIAWVQIEAGAIKLLDDPCCDPHGCKLDYCRGFKMLILAMAKVTRSFTGISSNYW